MPRNLQSMSASSDGGVVLTALYDETTYGFDAPFPYMPR